MNRIEADDIIARQHKDSLPVALVEKAKLYLQGFHDGVQSTKVLLHEWNSESLNSMIQKYKNDDYNGL